MAWPKQGESGKQPMGKYIEAAALLSHVKMLEAKLPPDETHFGHPQPPQLHMCRIMDPDREGAELDVVAMMAVTKRCIAAQLLKESLIFSPVGAPVEVLVMTGEDIITCSTMLALELPKLTAADRVIVPDRNQGGHTQGSQGMSLMSGGLVPVAPSPRLAIVVGTSHSRVISIEFSIKRKAMQLIRRNVYAGKEVCTYFEPLPRAALTDAQKHRRRRPPSKDSDNFSRSKHCAIVPFEPSGGVTTLVPYTITRNGNAMTHVWISFGDGTGLRLHHAGFFASVIQKHTESQPNKESLENVLGDLAVRWQAKLPPMEETKVHVIPIPKYHPSPLAPFPTWKRPEFDETGMEDASGEQEEAKEIYEAALYCTGAMADTFPTLAFYTSEDQFEGRIQGDAEVDESEHDSGGGFTTMLGGIFGMFSIAPPAKENPKALQMASKGKPEVWDPDVPFPSINFEAYNLYAGCEIHDPPRQITHCTVDPEGDLAAISDTLGRVSLVDLSTKQVVRMWKGFRDTSLYWLQIPQKTRGKPGQKSKTLYLVIHSRQRKVVEVWRTRHGPRVKSLQVGREAQVISCRVISPIGFLSTCYLAHSNVPFSSMNQVERIVVYEDESEGITNAERNPQTTRLHPSQLPQDAAARLNRLKQLLGDTNVECQSVDVFRALEKIKSVEDLATALDFLASASTLERKMGIEGSVFQRLAVAHCKEKLDEAIRDAGQEALTNPHVNLLGFKITYYSQIAGAYDILHRYEMGADEGDNSVDVVAPSTWGLEAAGWTSTYERITKKLIDDDVVQYPAESMKFHEFASALQPPKKYMEAEFDADNGGYSVHLSDSSKTRREILVRIFKPLLGDIFSFNVVNQLFEALGIKKDCEYLLKCFGEWFTSLSVKAATKKAIFAEDSPTNRWLQDIIGDQLGATSENPEQEAPMEALYQFCRSSEELVRAFWLATLCREAIGQAASEKEEETYGKISMREAVGRWDSLLRQIRVCLLVSLRLPRMQLGACPISVESVEQGDNFSTFEWLAQDELLMSHKHDEIVSLENACRISGRAFDPSKPEGDDPARCKVLQNSCLSSALSEDERAEYLVDFDDDDRLGALLLYLRPHNKGGLLVAHRALLLAAKWGRRPKNLTVLEDAIVALKSIDVEGYKRIAFAVRLEVWQRCIRPVYRALVMGFDDVQEITPEIVAPLFRDKQWVEAFSEIAATVLELLSEIKWHESENINLHESHLDGDDDSTWPSVTDCFLLNRLIDKNRALHPSALEAHQILMSALKVSKDIPTLSQCIPSFYDLFTPGILFNKAIPVSDAEEKQHAFMQDAIVGFARNYNGPNLDTLNLGEIEVLADLWEFDTENIKTLFLLSVYEFGKDRIVDELITKSAPSISVQHFCDDGVEIACRRLNHLLHVQPSDDVKKIMGSLDADMCEWIKETAENSEPLIDNGTLDVPPGNTHLFALRLLSLAASADIDKEKRIKIHSLIVLSGSIVKALEETTIADS